MIIAQNDRLQHKNLKFEKVKTRSKIDINQLHDLNNLRKPILNSSRTNFAQNPILKKKVAKFAQKYWKFQIFWISKIGQNWPISISKVPACSKICLSAQNQKFMELFNNKKTRLTLTYAETFWKIKNSERKSCFIGQNRD